MNVTQILYQNRIAFRRSSSDVSEIAICCPFCLENRGEQDKVFCLHVNVTSGAGHCWHAKCGYRSRNAIQGLIERFGGSKDTAWLEPEKIEAAPVTLPKDFQSLAHPTDELDREALRYLLKRGITKQQIYDAEVGVSYSGKYAYRIIFPIRNGRKLEMLVCRDFTGRQKPKYLNTTGAKPLFNFDPFKERVILSEGVFKALKIEQVCDLACSAALLGHDLTDVQLSQIKNSRCKEIRLWPDPDLVGRQGVLKIAEKLSEYWNGELRIVWPVKTPADESDPISLAETLSHVESYSYATSLKILLGT